MLRKLESKMKEHKKDKILPGEMGLARLITLVSNTEWKMVKMAFLKDIKENPSKILGVKGTFTKIDKMMHEQYMSIEMICEAVSYAELLGAYLLAFSNKEQVIQKISRIPPHFRVSSRYR